MTDYVFNICLLGLAGATLTFGIALGFWLRHLFDVRDEGKELDQQGWEPLEES